MNFSGNDIPSEQLLQTKPLLQTSLILFSNILPHIGHLNETTLFENLTYLYPSSGFFNKPAISGGDVHKSVNQITSF